MRPFGVFFSAALFLALALLAEEASAQTVPIPVAQVSMGPSAHLTPDRDTYYLLEVTGGVNLWSHDVPLLFVAFEGGYLFEASGLHAGEVGFDIGANWERLVSVGYHARVVGGAQDGQPAIGMRNGVGVHIGRDLARVEVAHQLIVTEAETTQTMMMLFGVNLGAIYCLVGDQYKCLVSRSLKS